MFNKSNKDKMTLKYISIIHRKHFNYLNKKKHLYYNNIISTNLHHLIKDVNKHLIKEKEKLKVNIIYIIKGENSCSPTLFRTP